jgi:acetylornithine deacetylase/succinyl-diaminopimelate desuccinylase-like protein
MSELDWPAFTEETIGRFKELLRIPTINPPGNERPAAELCAKVLAAEGIEYEMVEPKETRTSLVARLRGSGKKGPLLLNGHLDVVAVDREKWTHDPFAAIEADGCIWGRGAIDMKNMVTMSLMTLVGLKRSGVKLDRDVIFAAVADEEAGSREGALWLVENRPELVKADYVLNEVGGHTLHMGDRRYYPVQVAEKGVCWFEITAEGEPGHGSMPHPGNAVVILARAIERLGSTRLPQHVVPVVEHFLKTLADGAPLAQRAVMPLLLEPRLAGFLLDAMRRADPDQSRALNALLRNTASPTMLQAGAKVNVIPSKATAQIDGRTIPGQSADAFLAEIQKVIGPGLRLRVTEQHDGVVFPSDTPLYDAISRAVERHDPGGIAVPYMIPGFTDSFAYARLGAVCYGFSPVRLGPDLKFTRMYHGHDERIPRDGFAWGLKVLYELVRDFCAA